MTINKIWTDKFGDDYQERNKPTEKAIASRMTFFLLLMNMISDGGKKAIPKSILEIGAGMGTNLIALSNIIKMNGLNISLGAVEPNDKAREALSKLEGIATYNFAVPWNNPVSLNYELVFTSGVLIHISADSLIPAMHDIYTMAGKYILCMEYFSPEERMIPYRGQDYALWARDYGKLWLDNFKLHCIGYGFLWKPITGIDNVTWWLFEKVN